MEQFFEAKFYCAVLPVFSTVIVPVCGAEQFPSTGKVVLNPTHDATLPCI